MKAKKIFALALAAIASLTLQAQNNLPITTIGGHQFYHYEVGPNESIYETGSHQG